MPWDDMVNQIMRLRTPTLNPPAQQIAEPEIPWYMQHTRNPAPMVNGVLAMPGAAPAQAAQAAPPLPQAPGAMVGPQMPDMIRDERRGNAAPPLPNYGGAPGTDQRSLRGQPPLPNAPQIFNSGITSPTQQASYDRYLATPWIDRANSPDLPTGTARTSDGAAGGASGGGMPSFMQGVRELYGPGERADAFGNPVAMQNWNLADRLAMANTLTNQNRAGTERMDLTGINGIPGRLATGARAVDTQARIGELQFGEPAQRRASYNLLLQQGIPPQEADEMLNYQGGANGGVPLPGITNPLLRSTWNRVLHQYGAPTQPGRRPTTVAPERVPAAMDELMSSLGPDFLRANGTTVNDFIRGTLGGNALREWFDRTTRNSSTGFLGLGLQGGRNRDLLRAFQR